ncbi:hypothetical protein ASD36_07425 [Rhizobium sp. Root1334]|nr:hypothetical protein ASC96_12040 [Rhizobium sp. Root1204]KQY18385.1 hypothetical protein ASD36_07425 [Rhizobium sp. Root1334]
MFIEMNRAICFVFMLSPLRRLRCRRRAKRLATRSALAVFDRKPGNKTCSKYKKEGLPRQLLIWFVTVAGDILALS